MHKMKICIKLWCWTGEMAKIKRQQMSPHLMKRAKWDAHTNYQEDNELNQIKWWLHVHLRAFRFIESHHIYCKRVEIVSDCSHSIASLSDYYFMVIIFHSSSSLPVWTKNNIYSSDNTHIHFDAAWNLPQNLNKWRFVLFFLFECVIIAIYFHSLPFKLIAVHIFCLFGLFSLKDEWKTCDHIY